MDGKQNLRDHVKHTTMKTSNSCLSSAEPASPLAFEAPRKRVKLDTSTSQNREQDMVTANITGRDSLIASTGAIRAEVTENAEYSRNAALSPTETNVKIPHTIPKEYPKESASTAPDYLHHTIGRCATNTLNSSRSHLLEMSITSAPVPSESSQLKQQTENTTISGPSTMIPNHSSKAGPSDVSTAEASDRHVSPIPNDPVRVQDGISELPSDRKETVSDSPMPSIHEPPPVSRSTSFHHLRLKYFSELEYMLREFQKLERQLLGANTQSSVESTGSKERREKLHSFILHLEETIQQIVSGCELEAKCEAMANSCQAQSNVDDENVQKLEEHILTNLLPVKVRLKRQLAAQQGAKHNPAGMPAVRGGLQVIGSGAHQAKATFLRQDTCVNRRPNQLAGITDSAQSSLNQKPRSQTIDSCVPRVKESTVSGIVAVETENIMNQKAVVLKSDVSMAKSKETPDVSFSLTPRSCNQMALVSKSSDASALRTNYANQGREKRLTMTDKISWAGSEVQSLDVSKSEPIPDPSVKLKPDANYLSHSIPLLAEHVKVHGNSTLPQLVSTSPLDQTNCPTEQKLKLAQVDSAASTQAVKNHLVSDDERRRTLKRRRKKKKRSLDPEKSQSAGHQTDGFGNRRSKKTQTQRGPRNVEYMCALCNETYNSTCEFNPWWALTQHDCPKCQKLQIPRVDISAPANAIEYHPALLAHADENGGVNAPTSVMFMPPKLASPDNNTDSESDLSDDDGLLSDGDDSLDTDDSLTEDAASMSIAEQAENEKFGLEYEGPELPHNHAARLLVLILHASTCPGHHLHASQGDVCRSTKWMMLHVRDCPGTTATGDMCPFPWCRKVKHLLYHLVSCEAPDCCLICSPQISSLNLRQLSSLSWFRLQKNKRHSGLECLTTKEQMPEVDKVQKTMSTFEPSIAPVVELNAGGGQLWEKKISPDNAWATTHNCSADDSRPFATRVEILSKKSKTNRLQNEHSNLLPVSMTEESFSPSLIQTTPAQEQTRLNHASDDEKYINSKESVRMPNSDGLQNSVLRLTTTDGQQELCHYQPDLIAAKGSGIESLFPTTVSSLASLDKGGIKMIPLFNASCNTSESEVLGNVCGDAKTIISVLPGDTTVLSSQIIQTMPYVHPTPSPRTLAGLQGINRDSDEFRDPNSSTINDDNSFMIGEHAKVPVPKIKKEFMLLNCQESNQLATERVKYLDMETRQADNTRRQECKTDPAKVPENRLSSENLVLRVQ